MKIGMKVVAAKDQDKAHQIDSELIWKTTPEDKGLQATL